MKTTIRALTNRIAVLHVPVCTNNMYLYFEIVLMFNESGRRRKIMKYRKNLFFELKIDSLQIKTILSILPVYCVKIKNDNQTEYTRKIRTNGVSLVVCQNKKRT